jgi:hypothetical protein
MELTSCAVCGSTDGLKYDEVNLVMVCSDCRAKLDAADDAKPVSLSQVLRRAQEHFRWVAVVTYRAETGLVEVDHCFEELEELRGLIDRGPAWSTIETIVVRLNPKRMGYPDDTVEAAGRR